jgi:hypothetical protein
MVHFYSCACELATGRGNKTPLAVDDEAKYFQLVKCFTHGTSDSVRSAQRSEIQRSGPTATALTKPTICPSWPDE